MLFAAIPLALSIGLIFSVPSFVSPWATFAYVLVVLIVLRGSFSAFALPYAALGAELSQDYAERSVIMSYRNFFNICGTLLCFLLGFGVFLAGSGREFVSASQLCRVWLGLRGDRAGLGAHGIRWLLAPAPSAGTRQRCRARQHRRRALRRAARSLP